MLNSHHDLRKYIAMCGLSLAEIGRIVGVSADTVGRFRNPHWLVTPPTAKRMNAWMDVLNAQEEEQQARTSLRTTLLSSTSQSAPPALPVYVSPEPAHVPSPAVGEVRTIQVTAGMADVRAVQTMAIAANAKALAATRVVPHLPTDNTTHMTKEEPAKSARYTQLITWLDDEYSAIMGQRPAGEWAARRDLNAFKTYGSFHELSPLRRLKPADLDVLRAELPPPRGRARPVPLPFVRKLPD